MSGSSAHFTCLDPGPWQASQPTLISDQVVWYVSVWTLKFFLRLVEWHVAHIPFQFCAALVQYSQSFGSIAWFG